MKEPQMKWTRVAAKIAVIITFTLTVNHEGWAACAPPSQPDELSAGEMVECLRNLQIQVGKLIAESKVLQCRLTTFNVNGTISRIEDELSVTSLRDLRTSGFPLSEFSKIQNDLGPSLQSCEDGQSTLSLVVAYDRGLRAYLSNDFDTALTEFRLIRRPSSASEKAVASAAFRGAMSKPAGEQREALLRQAEAALEHARELAQNEQGQTLKEKAILRAKCFGLTLRNDEQSNKSAIDCLNEMIDRRFADHSTYYNLAALSARTGKYEDALGYIDLCLNYLGANYVHQREFQDDLDFKKMFNDQTFSTKLRDKISRFPL
jgi:tetratricopeptide (TPR) repeat protein